MYYLIPTTDYTNNIKLVNALNEYEALKQVYNNVYFEGNKPFAEVLTGHKKYAQRLFNSQVIKRENHYITVEVINDVTGEERLTKFDLQGNFIKSKTV